jgi:hypothetical protein
MYVSFHYLLLHFEDRRLQHVNAMASPTRIRSFDWSSVVVVAFLMMGARWMLISPISSSSWLSPCFPSATAASMASASASTPAGRTAAATAAATAQPHGRSRSATTSHSSTCGHPAIPSRRRACGFFVWDATSALLHKWCNHLLKDHIYEGKGGYLVSRRMMCACVLHCIRWCLLEDYSG